MRQIAVKYGAYREGRARKVILQCQKYLRDTLRDPLSERRWSSYWRTAIMTDPVEEKAVFEDSILEAASIAHDVGLLVLGMECGLVNILVARGLEEEDSLRKVRAKFNDFSRRFVGSDITQSRLSKEVKARVRVLGGSDTSHGVRLVLMAKTGLAEQVEGLSRHCETLKSIIRLYGSTSNRHDYSYMLWYDIVDSTGTNYAQSGEDVDVYRESIGLFKANINQSLHRLGIVARKKRADIYCVNGGIRDKDDEKHVFISGSFGLLHLASVLESLCNALYTHQMVHARIIVVPCNFAGTSAYKMQGETEAQGTRFWEHLSRLTKRARSIEDSVGGDRSLLFVATEELASKLQVPNKCGLVRNTSVDMETQIEGLSMTTPVVYSEVVRHTQGKTARGSRDVRK